MFQSKKLVVTWVLIGGFLISCSESDNGGPTAIKSIQEGASASGVSTSGASAGATFSEIGLQLGSLTSGVAGGSFSKPVHPMAVKTSRYAKMVSMARDLSKSGVMSKTSKSIQAAKTRSKGSLGTSTIDEIIENCEDGGKITLNGTFDDETGDFNILSDFDLCREDEEEINGQISANGSLSNSNFDFNLTIGSQEESFTSRIFSDETYTTVEESLTAFLEMEQSLTAGESLTSAEFSISMDGSATFDDSEQVTTMIVSNFRDTARVTESGEITTFDSTLNGDLSESWTDSEGSHGVEISFEDFNLFVQGTLDDLSLEKGSLSHSGDYEDVSISGTIKLNFTPDTDCEIEGTFEIVTVSPMHYDAGAHCPVSGQLTVNGNTSVEFSESGVDVTVGTDILHYDSCEELEGICEVEDLGFSDEDDDIETPPAT